MAYEQRTTVPVGKKIDRIYTDQLKKFLQPNFYPGTNLYSVLEHESISTEEHVKLEVYHVPGLKRPLFKDAMKDAVFEPAKVGDKFGPSWSTHWFKVQVKVPEDWKKYNQMIMFKWNCGNEGLIFNEDGEALVGLSKDDREEWIVPKSYHDGKWHTFYIETSCNALFGNAPAEDQGIFPPVDDRYYTLESCELFVPNLEARALKRDLEIINGCVTTFEAADWQKHRALDVASKIIATFRYDDPSTIPKCREIAKAVLGDFVDSPDVYKDDSKGQVYSVGHCHIDTAWLWPYAETRRKIGRSWASQLDLIERYPEYNFFCSQAVQYLWLKQDYPDLFDRLKKQVKLGRFVPIGGSWVESDTNLPSGESIARQFLYGQRFFEEHFGVRCKTFWLPDTFGYQAQIPQLCRGAEMERFITIKLSWNNINKFPHSTFNWVSPDGSQVLCHMPPSDNYNSNCRVDEVAKSLSNNKSVEITEKSLMLFGIGDGGGGPTEQMLEYLRRNRGVADTIGKLPIVKMNANVDTYFDEIIAETKNGKQLSTWFGELYFEYHRGTYTTEADIKLKNRKTEVLLHDLEYFATIASIVVPGYKYPKAKFDEIWDRLLTIQFHDVLPGSAIEMAYVEAREWFDEVYAFAKEIVDELTSAEGKPTGSKKFINTLPWTRADVFEVDDAEISAYGDANIQKCHKDGKSVVVLESKESDSILTPKKVSEADYATVKEISADTFVLENSTLKVTVSGGLVTSVFDKKNSKEIIAPGQGGANKFVLFEDKPLFWQGWDTEVYSLETKRDIPSGKASILESGPLRASVVVEQKISPKSSLRTIISLTAAADPESNLPSLLNFETEVDWHEEARFLKVEFPVDVYNDEASYDSMYGLTKRPTHYNTSWDMAKFEVCCHKYADLSEHGYGVTIINESKYGFATHGNTMRLSLLRSSKAPDGNADMGVHVIKYALQGHAGGLTGDIVHKAQNYNHDLLSLDLPSTILSHLNPVTFEGPDNVIISAIKRGEDDFDVSTNALPKKNTKSIIVRAYDSLGGKSTGYLISKFPVKKVYRTNLLEDNKEELKFSVSGGVTKIPIVVKRFEICSYRLEL